MMSTLQTRYIVRIRRYPVGRVLQLGTRIHGLRSIPLGFPPIWKGDPWRPDDQQRLGILMVELEVWPQMVLKAINQQYPPSYLAWPKQVVLLELDLIQQIGRSIWPSHPASPGPQIPNYENTCSFILRSGSNIRVIAFQESHGRTFYSVYQISKKLTIPRFDVVAEFFTTEMNR